MSQDTHNPDVGGIMPESAELEPMAQSGPEVNEGPEEISYHVPVEPVSPAPGARNGSHYTVVISTSQNPVQLLLGRDYNRVDAVVIAVDEPVVLAQNQSMAESVNNTNQATVGPVPSGAYIPAGYPVPINHCDEVWVAATSSSLTRVSVIVSYNKVLP